jgi:hypothetical protein
MTRLFHTDGPIVKPPGSSGGAPESVLEGFNVGDYVGNPLYTVIDEHTLAAVLLVLAPLLTWLIAKSVHRSARRQNVWAMHFLDRYRSAALNYQIASWAIGWSAVLHATLVFTHEASWYTALYAGGAAAMVWAGYAVLGAKRRLATLIVVGSVVTFWFLGAPADQLGIATKLIEIFSLALLAVPVAGSHRWRRLAPAGVVTLVVLTGLAAWIGAFATVGADGGHHGGEYPDPGTLVPYIETLEPTAEQAHFADDLYWETLSAIEKYKDIDVAAAAGYDVGVIRGNDHHAQNSSFIGDGRILDPAYPESLIYAESPKGPILVGVMFEMDGFRDKGPTDGGPIMLWHGHENVCFSLTPPALAGLESPFGGCPIGSFNIPRTGEMLHAWVMPGVPEEDRWGHVDEEWFVAFLAEQR